MAKVKMWDGNRVLELVAQGEGKPFSIGVAKAKVILDSLDDIKAFVDKYYVEGKAKASKGLASIDIDSLAVAIANILAKK